MFFNYNYNSTFLHQDWPFYHQMYMVYKEALNQLSIPFNATLFIGDTLDDAMYGTSRFLAQPWVIYSPQLLLLKLISVPQYIIIQYFVFYSISYYGLIHWINELKLSSYAGTFLIIIMSYNGILISLTAYGGPQESFGYFLILWFIWFVYKFVRNKSMSSRDLFHLSLGMALFFFIILSQADMHVYSQMVIVAGCILIFYPKKIIWYVFSVFLSLMFSLWYIIPVSLFSGRLNSFPPIGHWRRSGICGYGLQNGYVGLPFFEISEIDSIFIKAGKIVFNIIHHFWESLVNTYSTSHDNTQEYNLYISHIGVILLILALIIVVLRHKNLIMNPGKIRFIFGIMIVCFISIFCFNRWIVQLLQSIHHYNLVNAVPSRYFRYVFYFTVLLASTGFDDIFNRFHLRRQAFVKVISLCILMGCLLVHSYNWWMFNSQKTITLKNQSEFNVVIYNNINDPNYIYFTILSYLFSSILVLIGIYIYIRPKKYLIGNYYHNIFKQPQDSPGNT
tara:strand:- start:384 stop:1895 length:1512 start_codon:yes stop_codon:yes gene_type:complete